MNMYKLPTFKETQSLTKMESLNYYRGHAFFHMHTQDNHEYLCTKIKATKITLWLVLTSKRR